MRPSAPIRHDTTTVLRRRKLPAALALLAASTCLLLASCASTLPPPGVTAVTPFDVQRYAGRWYEQARLDHSFERGMTDVSATYPVAEDLGLQGIDQRLQPHPAGPHPLRQRRTGDGQAGAPEDRFLPVQG